jgi:sugar phosphate isomerase/epimerase
MMNANSHRVGIDALSVFGLPPVEFARLAGELGCPHISIGLVSIGDNLSGSPEWTLRDAALRRETVKALRDCGVGIALGEGFIVQPGMPAASYAADLDAMAELGAARISTLSVDPDMARSFDQIAELAVMAEARGIATVIEFVPIFTIRTLDEAVAAVRHVGIGKAKVLVDTMHVGRSGATARDLAALEQDLVGYIQLCDAPMRSKFETYIEEAMFERMVPGGGELPLRDYLRELPRDVPISLELPLRSRLLAGQDAHRRLSACVDAARALLAQLDASKNW